MERPRIALAVGVAACVLSAGCSLSPFDHDVVKDKKGLALNAARLSLVVDDLNSVQDPANTDTRTRAASSGCSTDSGDVFEPEAHQEWTLTGPARGHPDATSVAGNLHPTQLAQRAMEQIAARLISRGWSGRPRVRHTKDDVYVLDLHRRFPDHRVDLSMQGFSDSIIATAATTPRHVCTLSR